MAPSATPYGSSFPQAQFSQAALINPSTYSYTSVSSTALFNWGFYGTQSHVIYGNPEEILRFPCSMGNSWTDSFSGSGSNSGQSFNRSGSINVSYNGYGTVILPFGTFTNVARLEYSETLLDLFPGSPMIESGTYNVAYILPDQSITLFSSSSVLVDFGDGLDTLQQFSTIADPSVLGITESRGVGQNALIYPNPANDAFTIAFDAPVAERTTITLLDAVGKEVMVLEATSAVANTTTRSFNVSSIPRGMYIVRIRDAQGRSSNMPLVLH